MDPREQSCIALATVVESMEKAVGCGVTLGHGDRCVVGYECQSCGHLKLAAKQIRALYPKTGPSTIKEPKVLILGPEDILTTDAATKKFLGKLKKYGL